MNEESSQDLSQQQLGERQAVAELELAYAASASQDIAMAQEAQATEGDGLGSEDWFEPSGQA